MQRILVVTDHDDEKTAAVEKGLELARLSGAELEIVNFCFVKLGEIAQQSGTTEEELKQSIIDKKQKGTDAMVKRARAKKAEYKKIKATIKVIWEKYLFNWVVKRTQEETFDLVIKTGHRSETAFHTPTDWHLFRDCKVPVYLRSEKTWKKKRRVLVAIDVEGKGLDKKNKILLDQGRQFADMMGAELDCCFVIHVPKMLKELDVVDVSTYTKLAREEYLPKVLKLVEPYGLTKENVFRETGEPGQRIGKIAKKLKVDCVVIGSSGRKGVKGKLIGNTAEQVIKNLRTDMLVMNLT